MLTLAILDRLKDIGLVAENHLPTSDEVTYTPTHDTNDMTVGELAARMESVPSLKPALTSQLPEHVWEKDIYKRVKKHSRNLPERAENHQHQRTYRQTTE